ncbi:MAG: proline racemase family protein [Calditrichia bacterium]
MDKIQNGIQSLRSSPSYSGITVVDAHTGGEPLRVIVDGFPQPEGKTILEKRRFLKTHYDHLRTAVMWEPRGHADMYGALITEPETENGDLGVIFMHHEGYSTMCGHGIIALTRVVLELGLFEMVEPVTELKIDTPAGQVVARATIESGKVKSVSFENVPSFVTVLDQQIDISGLGKIQYDIAFGGAFYAFVDGEQLAIEPKPEFARTLIDYGRRIKTEIMKQQEIVHPFEKDLSFLYGTIFTWPSDKKGIDSSNVCIFAEGELDRSPTGTGVSARLALEYAKGRLQANQPFTVESIIGSVFTGIIVDTVQFGPHKAIIPQIRGTASIIGINELLIDADDSFKYGFFIR